jgi:hypothetical protein
MFFYADMRASMGFKGPVPTRKHAKDVDLHQYNLAVEASLKGVIPSASLTELRFGAKDEPRSLLAGSGVLRLESGSGMGFE